MTKDEEIGARRIRLSATHKALRNVGQPDWCVHCGAVRYSTCVTHSQIMTDNTKILPESWTWNARPN